MPKKAYEIIRLARKEAGMSQEAAAPKLYLTVKQLQRLEYGTVPVDAGTLGRMATVYFKPLLPNQYCQAVAAEAGAGPMPEIARPLPIAAMALVNRIYDFADKHRDRDLLRIAEDGVIDAKEMPEYTEIVGELSEITKAAEELKYSTPL